MKYIRISKTVNKKEMSASNLEINLSEESGIDKKASN